MGWPTTREAIPMKTAPRPDSDPTTLAFSYVRFSDPEQRKGDSLRRQTEAAQAWCERHGARLDAHTTLHDLGKSAYRGDHRKNPDRNALASFLKLVEDGRVPRGSFLVIESLDRLTREHIRPALTLLLNLIDAGVRIVQLKPVEMIYDEAVEPMQLMMALMELSRGNSESRVKSQRVGAAWEARRTHARNGHKLLTNKLPAWVAVEAVRADSFTLALVPERAEVIRTIFGLAADGIGARRIVARLEAEGAPAFGPSGKWSSVYVLLLLRDRRVIGECQPRKGRRPDGAVIKDYFPAAVSEAEFERAGRAVFRRKVSGRGKGGAERQGKHADPFAGLIRDGLDGAPYVAWTQTTAPYRYRILRNANACEGRKGGGPSFPLPVFEAAVLSCLRELDPHEIINGDHPDESLALAGQLAGLEARIAELEAALLDGDVAALARALRTLEERKRELAKALADARQKAAHPLGEVWGEAKAVMAALDSAPDPDAARLRLRSALRRMIEDVRLVVVRRGRGRLGAVQLWFTGGRRHRDYLIHYRQAAYCCEGGWQVRSLAGVAKSADLDLRRPKDAAKLAALLGDIDLAALTDAMR
jgi:DNA invertase Pin-like site-specific DNA recombinase